MNDRQKRVLRAWWTHARLFLAREWVGVLSGAAVGVAAAAATRLLSLDSNFHRYLINSFSPPKDRFDDLRNYEPYIRALAAVIVALLLAMAYRLCLRWLRSWFNGCTSGMFVFSAFSSSIIMTTEPVAFHSATLEFLFLNLIFLCISFGLFLFARIHAERNLRESEIVVDPTVRALAGKAAAVSDEPIQSWEEDALGRAAVVDIVAQKAMISRSPIIAVTGPFGSGKSSVLNLLKQHLKSKAVIVEFSTWLPGSEETLASYLFADIANECRKLYVVPGLRRSTRRTANALADTVPALKGILEFFPETTQRDDYRSLRESLSRIPKRVLVLLDELDRMDKEEAVTLLKIIRGISLLPNLTFVCALDIDKLIETVKGEAENSTNREYFEKFFPVMVPLPGIEPEMLRKAGVQRLMAALDQKDWFVDPSEKRKFEDEVSKVWNTIFAPFCGSLRALGLLSNDLGVAADLLRREVDGVELAVVEMLRRFRPALYSLIAENGQILTGGETMIRGGEYVTDVQIKKREAVFQEALTKISGENAKELTTYKEILGYLFPRFSKLEGGFSRMRWRERDSTAGEGEKRISNPSLFPAYFRYELPEAVFSSLELELFLRKFERVREEAERKHVFDGQLTSMEKGSLKRDDFLRKLSDVVEKIDLDEAIALARSAVGAANEYTYDMMTAFGEGGHVIRIVLRVALRLAVPDRISLLRNCILLSSDDTMAVRILTRLTSEKADPQLGVTFGDLYPAFTDRMRKRYGPETDATHLDLSHSDPEAFAQWGLSARDGVTIDRADRAMQRDFWLRRIGESRARLGETFGGLLMPGQFHYPEDPTGFIEMKLPVEDLRRLFDALPDEQPLTDPQRRGLRRLRKFLNGEYSQGSSIGSGLDGDDEE